ncbi:MAG TPA: DUF1064 domain-containing protein, partial [Phyllobacterium sp.]|nr:DUF1064 domain-containing protein [Phyllobacterium sp.]
SKYGNVKVVIDGESFDSKIEAEFFHHLRLRERIGEVYGIVRQKEFVIELSNTRICSLKVDFWFYDRRTRGMRAVDIKGGPTDTQVFRLKAKLVKAMFGVEVEIVREFRS